MFRFFFLLFYIFTNQGRSRGSYLLISYLFSRGFHLYFIPTGDVVEGLGENLLPIGLLEVASRPTIYSKLNGKVKQQFKFGLI